LLLSIPDVLTPPQIAQCRQVLEAAEWVDGKVTAGSQSTLVKRNRQLPEGSPAARQLGGLAPFPTRFESEYDTFGVGHSSTSVSAALGMAIAARQKGERRRVVAVIGDGALTAGLAYDALPAQEVAIRGRNEPMTVRTVEATRILSALVDDRRAVAA
jgi:hypothetical protein